MTPEPTDFTTALGNELRVLRSHHGPTLRAAAAQIRHATGMSITAPGLCRWERGHPLPLDRFITICQAYGAYAPYLIDAALRRTLPSHWEACVSDRTMRVEHHP